MNFNYFNFFADLWIDLKKLIDTDISFQRLEDCQ